MSHSRLSKEIRSTKQHYNKNAAQWASLKTDSFFHEARFQKFAKKLPKGASILDIGCAWGIHVPLFCGIGQHLKYQGIDISSSFLKIARRRYPQLSFSEANIADKTTLPHKKFDGFLALAVLMHVPYTDWPETFSNIEKMMRPGAIGLISLPTVHPSGDKKATDLRHFTLLNAPEQKKFLKHRHWRILQSGTMDGFTTPKAWQWYIVQLP